MRRILLAAIVGTLAACAGPPAAPPPAAGPAPVPVDAPLPAAQAPDPATLAPILRGRSRWTPVRWEDLPGFDADALHEAWNAWLRSCERPPAEFAPHCPQVRQLSIASGDAQRAWMRERLQPYRIESLDGPEPGLLTGYWEPLFEASRQPTPEFRVPLYRPPATLAQRRPWYSRQEIDSLPEARAALRGREIAWLRDPLDALALHIQGSGRLRVSDPAGAGTVIRVSFAGSNDQPYRSVGSWLLQQGAVRDASWPGIKAWAAQNPQRQNELLWSNPRYVFFREERLDDPSVGPRGAQGVALTPGRSVAVDSRHIPYGTPLWLTSPGPAVALARLVIAQDTGSAILGPLRADYFTGWGQQAGELAGRLKQPLQLWALWPR